MNPQNLPEYPSHSRVLTPGGNYAVVLPKPWEMPNHTMIQIDQGAKLWILTSLLQPTDAAALAHPAKKKPKRSRR